MSRRAWIYIYLIIVTSVVLSLNQLQLPTVIEDKHWIAFVLLAVVSTIAQFFEAEAPGRQSYYPHLVFFFAGLYILPPILFILLIAIPHIMEWGFKRLTKSRFLIAWYIQPFNIATHLIAGFISYNLYRAINPTLSLPDSLQSILAVLSSAVVYVLIDHLIIGQALILARNVSLKESEILSPDILFADFVTLSLGYMVAVLWNTYPLLIIPMLMPLVLIYRALKIPQLKKDAQTDTKTGLWNARHWTQLFAAELERSKRFERPLTIVMADLDLLRNINNTYGHLAGDIVLSEVAKIIFSSLREYDIAGRFGGEEFSIALPETDLLAGQAIAERIRRTVEETGFKINTSPVPIRVTLSLGVATLTEEILTPEDLIHQADMALYQAKLRGRNRVTTIADVPRVIELEQTSITKKEIPATKETVKQQAPQKATSIFSTTSPQTLASTPMVATKVSTPASVLNKEPVATSDRARRDKVWLLFGTVIFSAILVAVIGILRDPRLNPTTLGLFVILAIIAELLQVQVYKVNTVSVSVAVNFAAALIAGIPGVVCVSLLIAFVHYLQQRPQLYKFGYNWAVHILAGAVPVVMLNFIMIEFTFENLILLAIPLFVAAVAYYTVETGLIAAAIAVLSGGNLGHTWRQQFKWLAEQYIILCGMGMLMAISYKKLDAIGPLVFVLPVYMMHYTQKQYVERTRSSVNELQRMNKELADANHRVEEANQAIHQLNDELFLALAKIIDTRDPYVRGHAEQVATYAVGTAEKLGLTGTQLDALRQAALLHDIGKLGIAEAILQKPSPLTQEEYEIVKSHALVGSNFLETSQGLRHLVPIIKYHHERWDGSGYPEKLRGEEIPLGARILAVCDAIEAMASDRPYRKALPAAVILSELKKMAGTQFDPEVVKAFIRFVEQEGLEIIVNSAKTVEDQKAQSRETPQRERMASNTSGSLAPSLS